MRILFALILSTLTAFGATGSWNGVAFTAWNGVAQTAWNGTAISCAGGGGGGHSFTLTPDRLWLDHSDASKMTTDTGLTTPVASDGAAVAGNIDKSAAGNSWTQATGASKPTYKTGIKNGHSVLRFDGGDLLTRTAMTAMSTYTIYIVANSTKAATTGYQTLIGQDGDIVHDFHGTVADGTFKVLWSAGIDKEEAGSNAQNTWVIYTFRCDGSSREMFKNGVSVYSQASAGISTSFSNIGAKLSGGEALTGDIGEILIYSTRHSDGDVATTEGELNTYWTVH